MILEEFDYCKDAIINPSEVAKHSNLIQVLVDGLPKVAISCFDVNLFNNIVELLKGEKVAVTKNVNQYFPIYKVVYKGKEIAVFMMDMGAPGAAGQMEEVFALGIEKLIVFGSCGVLDKEIEDCSVIIPNSAVRDEGLSYHYLPASDEIAVNEDYIPEFEEILKVAGCKYTIGKTWTTDAIYRETREKMEKRKAAGCICVEMECSAMAAVAKFREKKFFQFLYAADCLDGEKWDARSLGSEVNFSKKDAFGCLALELAARI